MKRYFIESKTSSRLLVKSLSYSSLQNLAAQPPENPPYRLFIDRTANFLLSCTSLEKLHQVHAQVITHGLQHNDYISPKIITASCQLKEIVYARKVFDQSPDPNASLWNAMLKGYSLKEMYSEVLVLFEKMKRMDVVPNCYTIPVVLKSCTKTRALVEGEQVHSIAIKFGYSGNPFVGTALIDMYSVGGTIKSAFKAFSELLDRNVIAWTTMVNAYLSIGDIDSARHLFSVAPNRDIVLWNTMMSGYIQRGDMVEARNVFDQIPNRDVMSWNTLLNGYANNGNVNACAALFEEMPKKNIFSWNSLMSGYAHNGCLPEVLTTFKRMLTEGDVAPTDATIVTVLSATARLGALDLGMWIHVYAYNTGYSQNLYVCNALIDMYAKCGLVDNAIGIFTNMKTKDLVSWNTVINALAVHGRGADALTLFREMKINGPKMDGVTFLGVLSACTHLGLVDEGFSFFYSMIEDCSIKPQIEHYGCMVDLLSRAGLLVEAVGFVNKMPIQSDAVIWATLLGASKIHKNVSVAELSLEHLIELEPRNPSNYVMLSNIYGDLGRWKDAARLKLAMKGTGVRKFPGCSSIEVGDDVVEFYSLDERHPDREEIYSVLNGLGNVLRWSGYVPDIIELGIECVDGEESV